MRPELTYARVTITCPEFQHEQITVESFRVQPSTHTPKLTKIRTLDSEQEGALVCGCFSVLLFMRTVLIKLSQFRPQPKVWGLLLRNPTAGEYREGGERVAGVPCDPVLPTACYSRAASHE